MHTEHTEQEVVKKSKGKEPEEETNKSCDPYKNIGDVMLMTINMVERNKKILPLINADCDGYPLKQLLDPNTPNEQLLELLWNNYCVRDPPHKQLEGLLSMKIPDGRYFIALCGKSEIWRHVYTHDKLQRLPKYYIPPWNATKSPRIYIGETLVRILLDNTAEYNIANNGDYDVAFRADGVNEVRAVPMPSLGPFLSNLNKYTRRICTLHITEKVSRMMFKLYKENAKHIRYSSDEDISEGTSEERRQFDKIFEISGDGLYRMLTEDNLPGYLTTIVSILCMKRFKKRLGEGSCNKYDHMDMWDEWRNTSKYTKAVLLYLWMRNLTMKCCMECKLHFESYQQVITSDGIERALILFSMPLNSLNPHITIPIYSCCNICCNEKELSFVGDSFFFGMIPHATIMRKDNTLVTLYLLSVLRFLKSTAVIIQNGIMKSHNAENVNGEIYITEDSYMEKKEGIDDESPTFDFRDVFRIKS